MLDRLIVTISKTSDGEATYMQIASPEGAVPVNIVLIAEEITVEDVRPEDDS